VEGGVVDGGTKKTEKSDGYSKTYDYRDGMILSKVSKNLQKKKKKSQQVNNTNKTTLKNNKTGTWKQHSRHWE